MWSDRPWDTLQFLTSNKQQILIISMPHTYKKAYIVTAECDEFSQSEHICVTNTHIKKQNIPGSSNTLCVPTQELPIPPRS